MEISEIIDKETRLYPLHGEKLSTSHCGMQRVPHLAVKVALHPLADDLGQDAVRLLLLLVFGIADHHLDHRGLKLR